MIKQGIYARYVKRLLDILLAVIFLILLWWLYAIIAILVRIKLGSPVIFKQPRPGKDGVIFNLIKFRTMTDDRDENGQLLPDTQRLTKFGRFLRATSCDELPEVLLILTGKMSWIGPRPLAAQYLPYYSEEEKHRHDVRPGISGWAQVNGRNSVTWEERFAYDIEYVKKISFALDMKIIFMTIMTILKHSDIGERGVDAPLDFDVYRKKQLNEESISQ